MASGFVRAYDSAGENQTILLDTGRIISVFVRYRATSTRTDATPRRAGWSVEATIHTGFDGPTFTLAIQSAEDEAIELMDEFTEALSFGTFDAGGVWRVDETDGLTLESYFPVDDDDADPIVESAEVGPEPESDDLSA
jgi:hypothetical protein